MVKVKLGDEVVQSKIKFRVRMDFKGEYKPGKFLFGGKPIEQVAQNVREEQVSLLRNIPIQGISFEDCDVSSEPYVVYDDVLGEKVAYAPAFLTINADSIEDMIRFVMREEFRKIEVLEPTQMIITNKDLEKILFKMGEELRSQLLLLARKLKK
ncbi:hypothetical protein [Thermosediminibacter oceani]|uniref:Uncharacterized protein n=1 Tax=Thermosediminibacter oceani (strain ATCC BAA-1034 / DSM 16646 / JW/IW-1228P) TaxID=555079 RepID=D9S3D6_THEOJ|nr:hypothetical protein [Thermosediminibacter oceani]ADL07913.1 conserved hypothetical protein [Thermosediminibacter oceani DSM 16646]